MNILFTGSAGMLASDVIPQLLKQGHDVFQTDINQRLPDIHALDITNKQEVFEVAKEQKPDYIFHFAAETDVDLCERDPDHAFKVNTIGTENIVLASQQYNIKLLYISTAGVFFGDKPTAYTEFDIPRPANIYGDSKLQGEIIVQRLLDKYFIIRAGWMVGGWDIDKKFVYKIVQQLKDGKRELKVVDDKLGTPTFTKDFAANFMNIVESERYGLYHLTNKGTCSRYDIAAKIVEFMGLENEVKIEPINSAQFPLSAPRARSEMMRNYRLDLLNMNDMPKWEESLKEYIMNNASGVSV